MKTTIFTYKNYKKKQYNIKRVEKNYDLLLYNSMHC